MATDQILIEYIAEVKAFKEKLNELEGSLKKNEEETKKSVKSTKDLGTEFNNLPGPIGNASNAVSGLGKTFTSLLKNPIVLFITAIVGALAGLFKAFTSTDSGANAFNARMEQLSAIVDVVRQRAALLAEGLIDIFSGNFTEAADKFSNAVKGIGEQFNNATQAAKEYIFALDALEDSENNFISNRAENANKIAKLEFIAADRSRSITERQNALKEAIRLGEEESKQNIKFANERLEIEAAKLAGLNGITKEQVIAFIKLSDAEQENAIASLKLARNNNEDKFKALEEFYAKSIEADTRFFEENKRNNSKLSALNETFAKEEEDKRIARLKAQNESRKGERIEAIKPIIGGKSTAEIEAEQTLQVQTNLSENLKVLTDKQLEDDKFNAQERIRINKEAAEQRIADEKKFGEQSILIAQEVSQLLSGINQVQYNTDLQNLQELLNSKQISQEQFNEQEKKLAQEKAKRDKQIALFNAVINTASAILKAAPDEALMILAAAAGVVQIGIIQSQQPPKFEKGGLIGGKLHSAGGTLIEAERNEFIVRRNETLKNLDLLNSINGGYSDKYIFDKHVTPALRELQAKHNSIINNSLAENIANSFKYHNQFNDENINRRLDKIARISQDNTHYLSKVLRTSLNPRKF